MLATSTEWADVKARWVAALRSGDYAQGRGHLRGPDGGHCCLGVLCDVMGQPFETHYGGPDFENNDLEVNGQAYDFARSLIPEFDDIARATLGSVQDTLMSMNDDTTNPKSFDDIADWIENNL